MFIAISCEPGTDWTEIAVGAFNFAAKNADPNMTKGTNPSTMKTIVTILRARDRLSLLQVFTTHIQVRMLNEKSNKSPGPKPIELKAYPIIF
jgi:hypothetical protein